MPKLLFTAHIDSFTEMTWEITNACYIANIISVLESSISKSYGNTITYSMMAIKEEPKEEQAE